MSAGAPADAAARPAPRATRRTRKPRWIKAPFPAGERFSAIKALLREEGLHSVCEEASCPNIGECFNAGTATFMILGGVCTRACGFCDVTSGKPAGLDLLEPYRLARAVERLGLDYVVVTSVNRDDLADGGASAFAECIRAIRRRTAASVEVLVPDFEGDRRALEAVLEAGPAVLNHNIETVPRLYPRVRHRARYERSIELIGRAAAAGAVAKSGIMLGLGEERGEVSGVLRDLRGAGCRLLTIGQYLRPSAKHLPVARYVPPAEFDEIGEEARGLGFAHVASGPMVRSSYRADEQAAAAGLAVAGLHAGGDGYSSSRSSSSSSSSPSSAG